jgi:hypothetical protein
MRDAMIIKAVRTPDGQRNGGAQAHATIPELP